MSRNESESGHEEAMFQQADAAVRALENVPVDAAFSAKVLVAARTELSKPEEQRVRNAHRFFQTAAVPAALVACALGYAYHYIVVAERVYLSHGG
ncbi:MAG: hypothetical protein IPK82_35545 [Polyangiaceae bacterium]|nr:hypothetical protein [Polyangiaceae bacterium]